MRVKYVKQESNGCAIACIAMVLNKTYEEAYALAQVPFEFGGCTGLTMASVVDILGDQGYTCRQLSAFNHSNYTYRAPWPDKPFAPIHVVFAYIKGTVPGDGVRCHAVIMLKNGRIYDPSVPERTTLEDFGYVAEVVGFWPPKKWWQVWR